MEFEEELNQLKAIQKQTLQKYIALASQYNKHWTEYLEVFHKIQLICARQNLRAQEGFSPTNHPQNRPGFHQMNQNAQFEERQRYEKQMFEHQNDELQSILRSFHTSISLVADNKIIRTSHLLLQLHSGFY